MDADIIKLTTTAVGALELSLAELDPEDLVMLSGFEFVSLAGCSLAVKPGTSNWVEEEGGLPEYICRIARAIKRGGKSTSTAIAMAISQAKRWASGVGEVNADTRAKAAAAVAQWESMKAKARSH